MPHRLLPVRSCLRAAFEQQICEHQTWHCVIGATVRAGFLNISLATHGQDGRLDDEASSRLAPRPLANRRPLYRCLVRSRRTSCRRRRGAAGVVTCCPRCAPSRSACRRRGAPEARRVRGYQRLATSAEVLGEHPAQELGPWQPARARHGAGHQGEARRRGWAVWPRGSPWGHRCPAECWLPVSSRARAAQIAAPRFSSTQCSC